MKDSVGITGCVRLEFRVKWDFGFSVEKDELPQKSSIYAAFRRQTTPRDQCRLMYIMRRAYVVILY